ncbi:hypothetical protein C943_03764 [Mariniradius saccharolyticus AK6]|uniref:Uncharacterized protein n=1 Tax=Mariniradius saccharolyticus AK6 TaxID=1239962 RepID=M7XI88_9BACT|nr:hypothetical protein C943_03764 [Mariniradius saccharolyticus AK6]
MTQIFADGNLSVAFDKLGKLTAGVSFFLFVENGLPRFPRVQASDHGNI